MRTQEEQISHLSCAIFNEKPSDIDDCISLAREYIIEAERRAEQRVRAQIGRDSERLDWLETAAVQAEDLSIHCLMNTAGGTSFGVFGTGNYEETLREAIDAGGRQTTHGRPERSFEHIAARWSLTLGVTVTPFQVALMMADMKQVRALEGVTQGAGEDHLVDMVGYVALAAELGK